MSSQTRPGVVHDENSPQDLWTRALESLSVELRRSLDLTTIARSNVLSRALKEAQEKKRLCAQRSWTLKKPNGEVIILRDVLEKIIVWVEKFIAVGDATMQVDALHAAPAWGAFRFVLQVKPISTMNYPTC